MPANKMTYDCASISISGCELTIPFATPTRSLESRSDRAVVFISGFGLDYRDFTDVLFALDSNNEYLYTYYDADHFAITLPGFDTTYKPTTLLDMDTQCAAVLGFIKNLNTGNISNNIKKRNGYRSVIIYGFSYGADLLIHMLKYISEQECNYIEKIILCDPCLSSKDFFISKRLIDSCDKKQGDDKGRKIHFSMLITEEFIKNSHRYTNDDIEKMFRYFGVVACKDWDQLYCLAKEIVKNLEFRRKLLIQAIISNKIKINISASKNTQSEEFSKIKERLENFECVDIKYWQDKGHFWLSSIDGVIKNTSDYQYR